MSDEYQPKPKSSTLRSIGSIALIVVAIIAVSALLKAFVFHAYEIPSASMEETIMTGDLVFSEKVTYYFNDPVPGDIVTFEDPEVPSRTLIKRVVATEGQKVNLVDGAVYVDGEKLDEPYTDGQPSYPLNSSFSGENVKYPYTVPAGEVWVMGDNRTNSQDSRYFGSIPASSISGRAVFTYWPPSSIGPLNSK